MWPGCAQPPHRHLPGSSRAPLGASRKTENKRRGVHAVYAHALSAGPSAPVRSSGAPGKKSTPLRHLDLKSVQGFQPPPDEAAPTPRNQGTVKRRCATISDKVCWCAIDSVCRELSIGERACRRACEHKYSDIYYMHTCGWIGSRIAEVLHCIGRRRWQIEIQIAEHRHLRRHNGARISVIGIAANEPRERILSACGA
jgi:hypothetical protein